MHLPRIVSILYTTVTLAVVASADIIGWSNKDCTGAEGLDDACAGECIDFRGRNSFQVGVNHIYYIVPPLTGD